jgi:AcrR family transcriptional regulator
MVLFLFQVLHYGISIKFKVNQSLFLKDPEGSTIGKAIVAKSIDLIYDIGFEQFTFKKLAQEINTTEATIYRYFSSKQIAALHYELVLAIFGISYQNEIIKRKKF